MLKKSSPLKHLEGHSMLSIEDHKKAHMGEGVVDNYEVGDMFSNEGRNYTKREDGWYLQTEDGKTEFVNQALFRENQLKAKEPVIEETVEEKEEQKPTVLGFDQWHTNKGGEKTMVEKLQEIHGNDYEITEEVAGDDVVGIKRRN